MALTSINPASGEVIYEYEEMPLLAAHEAVDNAAARQKDWAGAPISHRATLLMKAAERLTCNRDEYARLISIEMGKPIRESLAEVDKCAAACRFFSTNGERFLAPEVIDTDFKLSKVYYRPLGVIFGIMPWNFPFWQVFRAAVPALLAGNAFVLKHAHNVTGCAVAIQDIFKSAEFPAGLFRTLLISSRRLESIIGHPSIQGVTLTGSTEAGRSVAALAGAALKKTVLELGGSDAYVILEDADLDLAAEQCVAARLINTGQSCIAAKRFIAVDKIRAAFEERVLRRMAEQQIGEPLDMGTTIGPLARDDLRKLLQGQLEKSVEKGATVTYKSEVPEKGYYFPLTVLSNVRPGMPAFDEELFGPIACITSAATEDEALTLANDSQFGLGACVFSRDTDRAERMASELLDAGSCFVNAYVRSDPRLPFGGIKESGYGRELSRWGVHEFVNVKTVVVAREGKNRVFSRAE